MIITKTVQIKLTKTLIEKFDYIGESGDVITIGVNELPPSSTKIINVVCDVCHEPKEKEYRAYLRSFNKYGYYTCNKCSKEKRKKTLVENYGVDNPSKSEEIKNKIKKTNLEKYGTEYYLSSDDFNIKNYIKLNELGVENYQQLDYIKDKSINTKKEKYGTKLELIVGKIKKTKLERYNNENYNNIKKTKKTNIDKYGVEYPLQNKEIHQKTIDTIFEKYGDYIVNIEKFRKKQGLTLRNTTFDKIKNKFSDLDFIKKEKTTYTIRCDNGCDHEFDINFNLFHLRIMYDVILCTVCNDPTNVRLSSFHLEVSSFLDELDIKHKINDRTILNGKELDIYIPEFNIGIECNGLYWHSELFKSKKYHTNKYEICKEKNIKLINIWEDDWKYKKEIIKSILRYNLNKTDYVIYGRKCEIREIKNIKSVRTFLNENHIQGFSPSNHKIGLYYNGELLSIMTFGYRWINSKRELELLRFCNKKNTVIIGSFPKLLNYFIKKYKNIDEKIITYADLSLFNGNIYEKNNFKKDGKFTMNFYWILNNKRYHRFSFNKKRLLKEGFDENLTGKEMMNSIGSYRLWGVGIQRWILK